MLFLSVSGHMSTKNVCDPFIITIFFTFKHVSKNCNKQIQNQKFLYLVALRIEIENTEI